MSPDGKTSPSDKPPVLIVGAFLSGSTGIRWICEDLAAGLEARSWSVTTTSRVKSRLLRPADMLATVWSKRRRYAVAQMDVYAGSAFLWAEAVGASLSALGCPFAITLHSGSFPEFAERHPSRVRHLLGSAAVVTSPSPFLKRHFASWRPDIRLVRNGLYLERYRPKDMTAARPKLVWIRAFEQRYNPVLALEVVRLLTTDFPEIDLVMAGPDVGDWSAEQTRAEAQKLGIQDRVRVIGAIPKERVPLLLQEGDIFLNTTNVDNAPVTVIEAMACGLCVVSTDAGGVPDLVQDGHDALLVPQGDAEAMATAVRGILVDPPLAADLSHNARRSAEAYDWDGIFSEWEELLAGLAG